MPPIVFSRMDEPVHVVLGDSAGSTARHARLDVIALRDSLRWGPSHTDPIRHGELRAAFWRDTYAEGWNVMRPRERSSLQEALRTARFSARELIEAILERPHTRPVLVWTVVSWQERLHFWWVLDALRLSGLSLDRFWVVQLQPVFDGTIDCLGCFSVDALEAALPQREPLTPGLLDAGAELWRKYASPTPTEFDEARRRGFPAFPDLPAVGEWHGHLYPQVIRPTQRLRLSLLDQAFLARLAPDAWHRPIDLLRDRDFMHLLFGVAGDQLAAQRLWAWANHTPHDPAILSRRVRGVNNFNNVEYRLTPRGDRICREGLESVAEAPPMWAGGCRVYDAENPWVRVVDGDQWRIEQFAR